MILEINFCYGMSIDEDPALVEKCDCLCIPQILLFFIFKAIKQTSSFTLRPILHVKAASVFFIHVQ